MVRHARTNSNNLQTLLNEDNPAARRGAEPPIERLVHYPGQDLEFENLSYSVMKRQKKDGEWITKEAYLLDDITGQVLRGQVTAILGPSGAGKSTFLDALAGRIARGSLEGSVSINGRPVSLRSDDRTHRFSKLS